MKPHFFLRIIKVLGICIYPLSLGLVAADPVLNECWISPNPVQNPDGSLANPYDGSSVDLFDACMRAQLPNSVIHLLPGTFQTRGGTENQNASSWILKSGQRIVGAGMDVTKLQLVCQDKVNQYVISGPYSGGTTYAEVSDMTLDCNPNSIATVTASYEGVYIARGSSCAVRRVKVIHVSGGGEVYGIQIDAVNSWSATGNIVEECEVSQCLSAVNGVNGIAFNSAWGDQQTNQVSGLILNNRIYNDPATENISKAINFCGASDVLVHGNYVQGVNGNAVFHDTTGLTNLIVSHNAFVGCPGNNIWLAGNNKKGPTYEGFQQNISILFNQFVLPTNGNGLWITLNSAGLQCTKNILLQGNVVSVLPNTSPRLNFSINPKAVTGFFALNNNFLPPGNLYTIFDGSTNISIFNNTPVETPGLYGAGINQIEMPNGVVRRNVYTGTTPNLVTLTDYYIAVKSLPCAVELPLPSSCPGARFVIADETGVTASNQLSVSCDTFGVVGYTTAFMAVEFVSDGTIWVPVFNRSLSYPDGKPLFSLHSAL